MEDGATVEPTFSILDSPSSILHPLSSVLGNLGSMAVNLRQRLRHFGQVYRVSEQDRMVQDDCAFMGPRRLGQRTGSAKPARRAAHVQGVKTFIERHTLSAQGQ